MRLSRQLPTARAPQCRTSKRVSTPYSLNITLPLKEKRARENNQLLSFGALEDDSVLIYAAHSLELTTLSVVQNQEAVGFLVICLMYFLLYMVKLFCFDKNKTENKNVLFDLLTF